jgi:uncharacterized membrane protein
MQMRPVAIDLVRERLPQLMQQARDQIRKLPLKRPSWPAQATASRWISRRMALAALLLGGIVHICVTFLAPAYTSGHAYRQLVDQLPPNSMTVLPQQAPGRQVLRELPPEALYAMCRYDLRQGAVAVRATVLGPGWALSVHTPQGSNFYVLTGQPDRSTDVSFVLVPSAPDVALPIPRRESGTDTQIIAPSPEGVIVLRAPVRGLAWTAQTEAVVKRASCAVLKQ